MRYFFRGLSRQLLSYGKQNKSIIIVTHSYHSNLNVWPRVLGYVNTVIIKCVGVYGKSLLHNANVVTP